MTPPNPTTPARKEGGEAKTAADVECPKCGAAPKRGCKTSTGWPARTHAGRFESAGLIEDADARWSAGQVFERERVADIDRRHADSPYSRGYQAGINGVTGPAFPKGDASWEERLYARGWSDAALSPARLQEEDK